MQKTLVYIALLGAIYVLYKAIFKSKSSCDCDCKSHK